MERETGFEPATLTLARLHSTAELFPLNELVPYTIEVLTCQYFFAAIISFFCRKLLNIFFLKNKTDCFVAVASRHAVTECVFF